MRVQYQLTEDDFLQHQLYISSQSPRIQNQRRRSWMLLFLAFLAIAYFFSQQDNDYMVYMSLAVAILTLIFYPFFQRKQYFNHYKRFIAETYKGRFNAIATLELRGDHIFTQDQTGDSTILWSAVSKVVETGKHIFIQMQTGGSLIIVKTGLSELDSLKNELRSIATRLGIVYSEELAWKWK